MYYTRVFSRLTTMAISLLLLAACTIPPIDIATPPPNGETPGENGEIRTLYVGPELAPCTGVEAMECLQVRESLNEPYELFYDDIEGFDFEPGFEYELRVEVEEVADPPADASSLRYTLVEVVNQTSAAAFPLEGTLWLLHQVADESGELQPALPDSDGFILLENGELGGTAGCNSFFSDYTLENSELTFGVIGSTLMACDEPLMSQEVAVFAALEATARYRSVNATLTLLDETGAALAVFIESAAGAPETPITEAPETAAIEGIQWHLSHYVVDGELQPAVGDTPAFLLLQDGEVTGHSGCNQFGAARGYMLDGGTLRFGQFITTDIGCPSPLAEQEAALHAALAATAAYTRENDTLTLTDGLGTTLLVFVAEEMAGTPDAAPIEGVEWALTHYAHEGELRPAVEDTPAFLLLDGGEVLGHTGCNQFSGAEGYTLDGDSLSFGPVISTLMACPGPIAEQEQAFLMGLNATAGYTLEGDTLTLVDAAGVPLLVFAPADIDLIVSSDTPVASNSLVDAEPQDDLADDVTAAEQADMADPELSALESAAWTLATYRNRSGEMVEPVAPGAIQFAGDEITGSSGCNSMFGGYFTEDERLSFGAIATTRMGCAPDIAAQEFDVLERMRQVAAYTLEADTLSLLDGDGEAVLVFAAE